MSRIDYNASLSAPGRLEPELRVLRSQPFPAFTLAPIDVEDTEVLSIHTTAQLKERAKSFDDRADIYGMQATILDKDRLISTKDAEILRLQAKGYRMEIEITNLRAENTRLEAEARDILYLPPTK